MYCATCGEKLAEGAKFCPACGAAVGGEEAAGETESRRTTEVQTVQGGQLGDPRVSFAAFSNHAANVISVGIERQNEYRDAKTEAGRMEVELEELRQSLRNCRMGGIVLAVASVFFYFWIGSLGTSGSASEGIPMPILMALFALIMSPLAYHAPFGLSWTIAKLRNSFTFWVAILLVSATVLLPLFLAYIVFICPFIGIPCRMSMRSRERRLSSALETQRAYADSIVPRAEV